MKASLSEYMKALSGDQFSILEEIIQHKYRKFMSFFDLINEYSDDIESMKYNFTDQNTLDIELSMKAKRSLKNELIEVMKDAGYKIDYKVTNKKMKLLIIYDESTMP